MSEQTDTPQEEAVQTHSLFRSIQRNARILGLFALACTLVIAFTFLGTEDEIEQRIKEARLKALLEIVPKQHHDNDMLEDSILLFEEQLGHRRESQIFLARQQGEPYALIYSATAREGYSGDIDYIVGIRIADQSIAGVRVLSHKETPGLGDKVDLRKSDWILDFNDTSFSNPAPDEWAVKKDGGYFDGFTGATITPRALVSSIAVTLGYHRDNYIQLLKNFD